jgi:hypothetical protein
VLREYRTGTYPMDICIDTARSRALVANYSDNSVSTISLD